MISFLLKLMAFVEFDGFSHVLVTTAMYTTHVLTLQPGQGSRCQYLKTKATVCNRCPYLVITAMSLLLCLMDVQMSLPCNHSNEPFTVFVDVQMSLPCNHSNESSTMFDGCADVVYNEVSRKKVPVVDAQCVAKFIRFQDINQLVHHPLLIIDANMQGSE